jgi:hypothetical protein
LTFAQHVTEPKEAQRRLNSLLTNVIQSRYEQWVRVFERQESGRIHYHLLLVLADDIRTGVDFDAFERQDYRTASEALRSQWAFWRDCAPSYGFGRTELLPVKSTSEGIARYVGKYVSKHIENRQDRDKGVRLVAMSKGARIGSTRFAWATPGAWLWRKKLSLLAESLGIDSIEEMSEEFGPRWAYRIQEIVARFQLREYPNYAAYLADGRRPEQQLSEATNITMSRVDEGRLTLVQARPLAARRLMPDSEKLTLWAFGSAVALGHRPRQAARLHSA